VSTAQGCGHAGQCVSVHESTILRIVHALIVRRSGKILPRTAQNTPVSRGGVGPRILLVLWSIILEYSTIPVFTSTVNQNTTVAVLHIGSRPQCVPTCKSSTKKNEGGVGSSELLGARHHPRPTSGGAADARPVSAHHSGAARACAPGNSLWTTCSRRAPRPSPWRRCRARWVTRQQTSRRSWQVETTSNCARARKTRTGVALSAASNISALDDRF
jgi:hypothetical protein